MDEGPTARPAEAVSAVARTIADSGSRRTATIITPMPTATPAIMDNPGRWQGVLPGEQHLVRCVVGRLLEQDRQCGNDESGEGKEEELQVRSSSVRRANAMISEASSSAPAAVHSSEAGCASIAARARLRRGSVAANWYPWALR